ncbi:dehydrodolichyl diphosphate synthase complex subunit Nus1p [Trichomonascus vanleenenianus]|uniref:ditrans,polycis-polyprenyl diphosphate synthase n=1 Tax=Trichomonascus vanleenenianus TaxID=2268995 RepID=UPI003ECAABA2
MSENGSVNGPSSVVKPLGPKSSSPDPESHGSVILGVVLQVFYFVSSLIHWFTAYYHNLRIKLMMLTYHHNKTPLLIRNDVRKLSKIPQHVAVIVDLDDYSAYSDPLSALMSDAGEIAAWSIGSGIATLSIYERTAELKREPKPSVEKAIQRKLESYFGAQDCPEFVIKYPGDEPPRAEEDKFVIYLLAQEDGRETIVTLTRTLSDLAIEHKIRARDLSVETIDQQLTSMLFPEPDLLVLFSPYIDLQGFPPWQIRLSEIFHEPDNHGVSYAVFYRALQRYAHCKINVGR